MSMLLPQNKLLYLILDEQFCYHYSPLAIAHMAIQGGVNMLQLRDKSRTTQQFIQYAQTIKNSLSSYQIPLIINDNIEVAMAIAADGLHLGQQDLSYPEARRQLGENKIIGLTIENFSQAQQAQQWPVDYIGVGPIYQTASKPDAPLPLGTQQLLQICQYSRHPVIAIGGICDNTIRAVAQLPIKGIALINAICCATKPMQAAKVLHQQLIQTGAL